MALRLEIVCIVAAVNDQALRGVVVQLLPPERKEQKAVPDIGGELVRLRHKAQRTLRLRVLRQPHIGKCRQSREGRIDRLHKPDHFEEFLAAEVSLISVAL